MCDGAGPLLTSPKRSKKCEEAQQGPGRGIPDPHPQIAGGPPRPSPGSHRGPKSLCCRGRRPVPYVGGGAQLKARGHRVQGRLPGEETGCAGLRVVGLRMTIPPIAGFSWAICASVVISSLFSPDLSKVFWKIPGWLSCAENRDASEACVSSTCNQSSECPSGRRLGPGDWRGDVRAPPQTLPTPGAL